MSNSKHKMFRIHKFPNAIRFSKKIKKKRHACGQQDWRRSECLAVPHLPKRVDCGYGRLTGCVGVLDFLWEAAGKNAEKTLPRLVILVKKHLAFTHLQQLHVLGVVFPGGEIGFVRQVQRPQDAVPLQIPEIRFFFDQLKCGFFVLSFIFIHA